MKSEKHGVNSSICAEIIDINDELIVLRVEKEEFKLDYENYPWFKDAAKEDVRAIEIIGGGLGIRWPRLDVDLELESLRNPERYPLRAKV